MEWLKILIAKYLSKGGKNLTNLAVVLVIGVIIMIAGSSFFSGNSNTNETPVKPKADELQTSSNKKDSNNDYGNDLESKLESILSNIDGVGEVSVMITFESGTEIVPAEDQKDSETITEEKDTQGGNRKITQFDKDNKIFIYSEQGGEQEPLILKELNPKVKGVIIAAEGAKDLNVKANIYDGVKTVLGISPHKVQVFQLKK